MKKPRVIFRSQMGGKVRAKYKSSSPVGEGVLWRSWKPRKPPLTIGQILRWAQSHHKRTGQWPTAQSGPIHENPADTWCAINNALRRGSRGLPKYSGITYLLEEYLGTRNKARPPQLTIKQILAWANEHRASTGQWPRATSGVIVDTNGETWSAINTALCRGSRGLPGGDTLHQLLERYGKKNLRKKI